MLEFLNIEKHFIKVKPPIFTEEIFKIKKIILTKPFVYKLFDLKDEEILGYFYEQELSLVPNPDEIEYKIATNRIQNNQQIIDDCANLHDSKIRESELCYLAFSGRHFGITTWVLNQKYNSIVKDFRENIRFLVLFYNKDRKSMQQSLEENQIIPTELHDEYINKLKNNKGSKLLMRLQFPYEYKFIK